MNCKPIFCLSAILLLVSCVAITDVAAQQYKIRQSSGMMGMNSESTVYVKGMRKRTEPGKMMGMQPPVTIEQCDLQRTIKINDKKKLYFIEPMTKPMEEIIDEDAPKTKPALTKPTPAGKTQKGGVIEMWNTITDTAERKQMYGLTARHLWTYMKMKPSADACYMKDSMIIKTDGWYVDLPKFNCPVNYSSFNRPPQRPGEMQKPDCMDRYVNHRKGKGKLGFPLTETRTIIMGGSNMPKQMGEMTTTVQTLEFSLAELDSMLFEIPAGYTETKNEEELQDKMSMKDMMDQYKNNPGAIQEQVAKMQPAKPGAILIGVLPPSGGDEQLDAVTLQQRLINCMSAGTAQGVAVSSAEDAKSKNCTYLLTTEITKLKSGSKVGGLLKAIKNTDPAAASSFNVESKMTLTNLKDDSIRSKQNVSDKFEGKANEAAGKALDKACSGIMNDVK